MGQPSDDDGRTPQPPFGGWQAPGQPGSGTPAAPQGGQPTPQPGQPAEQGQPAQQPPAPQWGQQPQWGQRAQQPPAPQWGQPAQWGQQPQWGGPYQPWGAPQNAPQNPYGGYTGYIAPPKPGVIPLRPLGVGEILDGAFQAARKNAAAVFGSAILLQIVVSVLAWAAGGLIISLLGGLQLVTAEELSDESAAALGLSVILSSLVLGLLSSVGVLLLQGVLAIPTARAAVNQKTGFALMWSLAKGRVWTLVGMGLLYLVATVVALVAIVAGSFFLADQLGITSVWIILLVILGLTVLSVWIGVKLMLAPAVIVMERAGLVQSLVRSWQLTNRSWWRTFGIILLCTIIVGVITSVISTPISFFIGLAAPAMGDPSDPEAMLAAMGPLTLVSMLVSSLFAAIGYAFQAAVIALVYLDLRIRREGFDVVLMREHEEAAGQPTRTIPGLAAASGSVPPGAPDYR
jgi:membrane-anchored glycerophosphoryl diester phosphodiesterase (GDPDase)